MTGIDRLRTLAGEWDAYGLGGTLEDIARQIERERACDEDAIENVRLIVGGVVDEMERHVSGVEGAEDSPVARWARELRRALKSYTSDGRGAQSPSWHDPAEAADVTSEAPKVTRDPADDVSMSAYDLLPADEREAIAWVRDHGGLERVKAQRRESMPRAAYERKKAGFLSHIAECERALGRRRDAITRLANENDTLRLEIAQMRPRLMPDGMEWLVEAWPKFEDDAPLGLGDVVEVEGHDPVTVWQVSFGGGVFGIRHSPACYWHWFGQGERIKRPAPKVIDADGAEIRVGDTVYDVEDGCELVVTKVTSDAVFVAFEDVEADKYDASQLTHRAPVLAADGEPLEVGQTVWDENGDELVIGALEDGGHTVTCRYVDVGDAIPVHGMWSPSQLTHERPVFAADGRPLREGETVWDVSSGIELTVIGLPGPGEYQAVKLRLDDGAVTGLDPDRLTHERPIADTWERLEEDARGISHDISWNLGNWSPSDFKEADDNVLARIESLVRRAKALAEREGGE